MIGETNLHKLLANMAPELRGTDWGYAATDHAPPGVQCFATVAEDDGLTLIAPMAQLQAAGLHPAGPMARITLTIHSSLEAVGLTAALATALAGQGISANVIAGFHHDHIFLPAADAGRAMDVLKGLSNA